MEMKKAERKIIYQIRQTGKYPYCILNMINSIVTLSLTLSQLKRCSFHVF